MTFDMIYNLMKHGKVLEVWEAGCLDVGVLRMAVEEGWMTNDEALQWYDCIANL